MSKVLSVGLATIMLIASLVGADQPVGIAGSEPSEEMSVAGNPASEDAPDQDEAVEEQKDAAVEPPIDGEEGASEQEDLTPVEEPAEAANSPPVVEDLVVEDDVPSVDEAPVVEEESGKDSLTNLIAPSAVDPDPGDCPIGEVCDGGGGGNPVTVDVGFHATSVEGINTVTVAGATYTLSQGATLIGAFTGNHNGYVVVPLVSGTTYSVVITANGYDTEPAYSVTPTIEHDYFSFMLHKSPPVTGTVTLDVIDAQTRQPIQNAEISLVVDRTWSSADAGTTGANGQWTSKALVEGKYWVSVSFGDDHHAQYDIELNIPTTNAVQIQLQRITRSPISLKIVDATTGDPVEGAFFYLYKEFQGTDVEDVTPASGEFTTEPLEHGSYGINVMADGYGYVLGFSFNHPSTGTVVIEMQPYGAGSLTLKLVDDQTGDPLPNAYITIFTGNFGEEIAVAQTDQNGEWTTPELPGGFYAVAIYPVHHYAVSFTLTVTGNHSLTLELTEFNDVGYLDVHVIDVTYGYDLQNAKVTVREVGMGIVATGLTDEDGEWVMPQFPAGHYTITVERSGYNTQVIEVSKNNGDYHLDVELHMPGQWNFRFWLRLPTYKYPDRTTYTAQPGLGTTNGLMPIALQTEVEYVPVVGASVQLLNEDTLEVVAETISGEDGFVDLGNVTEGNYILQITGDGFEDYSEPVSITGDMEFQLDLTPSQTSNPGDDEVDDGEDDPGTTNPDDGTNPDSGNPGGDPDPDTDNPDGDSNPETGNPGEDPDPQVPGSGAPVIPDEPGNDGDTGGEQGDGSTPGGPDSNEGAVDVDDPAIVDGSVGSDAVAQAGGSISSDATTGSVSQLPNTGVGESKPQVVMAAITLVAGFILLSALGVRRRL